MGLPKIAVPEYSLKLPSDGKEVKYRPFLVKEEKLLLMAMETENEKEIMNATKNVITSCVFGDIDVPNIPTFDVEYIFLWLRAKAKGEIIDLKYTCPKCAATIPVSFNIEDIKVTKEEKHSSKVEITDELGVVLKYPNMSVQVQIDQFDEKISDVEKIFQTVLLCIDYIYDKENMYSVKELYKGISEQCGVPIVFDYYHHKFCTGGLTEEEALKLAVSTWPKDIVPLTHYSESRRKEKLDESIKAQAHSDLIKDTIQTYGLDIDVVVEAKHKELAVLNYKN